MTRLDIAEWIVDNNARALVANPCERNVEAFMHACRDRDEILAATPAEH